MLNQPSIQQYAARFPKYKELFERAKGIIPRGVPHDRWDAKPFPLFMEKAKGSRVWDVDGYEYIDYYGGHGGKMLGHAHPAVVNAVKKQIENGIQYGAYSELSLEWAELIKKLIPSAELVEFTNSGTEAIMMGIRIARAFTGRSKIVRFQFHFSGGYDAVLVGVEEPFDVPISTGILSSAVEETIVIPANSEEALEASLNKRDVAALIVEAAGSSSGVVGIKTSFYQNMRDLTKKYDSLLFFDEVITGFRYSPGGVQAAKGITPDLTALGKGVSGNLPGAGAIVGCKDVMNMLLLKDDNWNRYKRVSHVGTFNGNPLCAASGIAYLKIIATGEPTKGANENTRMLRDGMQHEMDKRGIIGCVYDSGFSVLHMYFGKCDLRNECDRTVCINAYKSRSADVGEPLFINLALNGVKLPTRGFDLFVSAVNTKEDIKKTIEAFGISFDTMIEENRLPK